jgi:hypothetical protein
MQPRDSDAAANHSSSKSGPVTAPDFNMYSQHQRAFAKAKKPAVERPPQVDGERLARQWESEAVAGISPFRRAERREIRERARAAALVRAEEFNSTIDAQVAELEKQAKAAWTELRAHQPHRVVNALDDAFARYGLQATCEDAGLRDGQRFATIVVIFDPISVIPTSVLAINARGDEVSKRMPKADRNALYIDALGSSVLATVKCSFASAPSLQDARVIVLRHDAEATRVADRLQVIYRGAFERAATTSLPWRSLDPGVELLTANDAELQRRGVAEDVVPLDVRKDPALVSILAKFRAMLEAAPHA